MRHHCAEAARVWAGLKPAPTRTIPASAISPRPCCTNLRSRCSTGAPRSHPRESNYPKDLVARTCEADAARGRHGPIPGKAITPKTLLYEPAKQMQHGGATVPSQRQPYPKDLVARTCEAAAALGRHGPIPGKAMTPEVLLHETAKLLPHWGATVPGPRKGDGHRNLVAFRLYYPLDVRKTTSARICPCLLGLAGIGIEGLTSMA